VNELGGISLIGVQDAKVLRNRIDLNHRAPIILYHYVDDHYFDVTTHEGRLAWFAAHHPIKNVKIANNTLFVGPDKWSDWHGNKPDGQPVIDVNNAVYRDPYLNLDKELLQSQKFEGIYIAKNIMANPCNSMMVRFGGVQEAWATYLHGNMCWAYDKGDPCITVPFGDYEFPISVLEGLKPDMYAGNLIEDPEFPELPWAEFVPHNVGFDWSKHNFGGDMHSIKAAEKGIGYLPQEVDDRPSYLERLRAADIADAGTKPMEWEHGSRYAEMEA
jgi:hypothetical protein